MILSFDHNCLIYFENKHPDFYPLIIEINELSIKYPQLFKLTTCAIHASENQKGKGPLQNISQYLAWLKSLDLNILSSQDNILKPIGVYGLTFWDFQVFSYDNKDNHLNDITKLLTPVSEFNQLSSYLNNDKKFRNTACDILSLEAAVRNNVVFITQNTKDFLSLKTYYSKIETLNSILIFLKNKISSLDTF
jgi:hypothetical protein